jgi:dGTPase
VTAPELPAPAGYGDGDVERLVPEPGKRAGRTAFERDRARVVHSAALRRLSAKTQVVGPGTDDFVRNRLTHSLEVAQVGRELGQAFGCAPDLVDTACLAHDLGHPPFGHNGEAALAEVAEGCGGFEGNAQTLRLLTRLEAKTADAAGRSVGLNLTRASLDAATKYPWPRGAGPGAPGKFGVYPDDRPVFDWFRAGCRPGRRCVEAQVMDLADDVAYSVHDVEDAVVAGRLQPARLGDPDVRARVAGLVRAWYLPDATAAEVVDALDRLRRLPSWVPGWDGSRRCLAALKNLTSDLIGRFCAAVEEATRAHTGPGRLTRHSADLVVPRDTVAEIVALKGVAAVFVMTAEDRQPLYARQREIVHELVDGLLRGAPAQLEPVFRADWEQAGDDASRLRVVVDQVASLTDASAVELHTRLTHR